MRLLYSFFVFAFLFNNFAIAQKKELKTKFGKISDAEINMASYKEDPAAMGVILFDKGDLGHRYDSNNGFSMAFERHTRIKIFNREALDLADVFVFHHKSEKVGEIKATAYNFENGKIVETDLKKDNIFVEKLTKNQMLTKFTIPGVKEGSIIEYTYTLTNQGGVGMLDGWEFQQVGVPTIWSEFTASIPTFVQFKKMSQGWVPFALAEEKLDNLTESITYIERGEGLGSGSSTRNINLEYTANKMHFIQENVPALKTEPYVNSPRDYVSRIDFDVQAVYKTDFIPSGTTYRMINTSPTEYNRSWNSLGKDLLEDVYEDFLNSEKHTASTAKECTAGLSVNAEKIAAVYGHIGKNYQVKDLNYIWKTQGIDALVKDRVGTPTDLNLLFINMLRRVGVAAWPVMISTAKHGRVMPFRVSTDEFNRVIAAVQSEDSTLVLVDMAGYPNPVGLLASEDLNNEGLLLRAEDDIQWIPLQNKVSVKTAVIANFNLLETGEIKGNATYMESGYGAVAGRKAIRDKGAEDMVKQRFKEWFADGTLTNVKADKADSWHEPNLKAEFTFETNGMANASGNKIYLTPMTGLGLHENPFKNPERKFNIDFGSTREESYNLTFTIPAGYKVEEMPKGAKISFNDGEITFDYLTESSADKLKINVRKKLKKSFVEVVHYEVLQQFYTSMLAKMEEQIVLTKL
jgi:Domain of Unknown Function with PDB structure (DUF3857)/Transglutaminase-like superfamily